MVRPTASQALPTRSSVHFHLRHTRCSSTIGDSRKQMPLSAFAVNATRVRSEERARLRPCSEWKRRGSWTPLLDAANAECFALFSIPGLDSVSHVPHDHSDPTQPIIDCILLVLAVARH